MNFITEDDQLTIQLTGWEKLWGLRRKIILKRRSIAALSWQPHFVFRGSMFRVGGTGLPNVLYAGYFHGNGQRYFLYVHKPRGMSWTADGVITAPNILDITTVDYKLKRLLLTCDETQANALITWWNSSAHPTEPSGAGPE